MLRSKFIIKHIKNKRVLDLGFLGSTKYGKCPKLHQIILKNSKFVVGVDLDSTKIKFFQDNFKSKSKYFIDNVLTLHKVKKYVKNNEKFDVIFAGELIEHLENPDQFLVNCKSLVKKDGIIIMTTPNIYALRFIVRHTLLNEEYPYWKNRAEEIKYGHVIGFSRNLLKTLCERKGYKVLSSEYIIDDRYRGFKGNMEKFLSLSFPKFSPSIGIIITKK